MLQKTKTLTLIILFTYLFFIVSCKPDNTSSYDVGYEYFPYTEGKWVHYNVDSVAWDDFLDTVFYFHFQVLEIIESKFIDAEGNDALRIERYYRASDTSFWEIKDIWFANAFSSSAQLVEENLRFIKLSFPVRQNHKWDGNALNFLEPEIYSYSDIHKPLHVNGKLFDSTVTVIHSNINYLTEEILDLKFMQNM